jgi:hypothetical protein
VATQAARAAQQAPGTADQGSAGTEGYSAEEQALIEQRLADLGYM